VQKREEENLSPKTHSVCTTDSFHVTKTKVTRSKLNGIVILNSFYWNFWQFISAFLLSPTILIEER